MAFDCSKRMLQCRTNSASSRQSKAWPRYGNKLAVVCVLSGWIAWVPPMLANDTTAELRVGGLVFTKNADISIESEDLKISPESVSVRYVFLNHSTGPLTVTVAFPLPDTRYSSYFDVAAIPVKDPNFVGFSTLIDGKAAEFTIRQQAFVGDKDVTAELRQMGIPLTPLSPQWKEVAHLPRQILDRAISEDLILEIQDDPGGAKDYDALWRVRTSFVREQTFPPNKPVVVEHRYRPSVGTSSYSWLEPQYRLSKDHQSDVQRYEEMYCPDGDFLKGIEKVRANELGGITELRISYVLTTGANWAGPIKNFHLVVDKGRPDRIISFCADRVKKISPTAFEIRRMDFTPTRDIDILIIERPMVCSRENVCRLAKPIR